MSSILVDLPYQVGVALGQTGTTASDVGGLVLSLMCMVGVAILLSILSRGKVSPIVLGITELGLVGLFTAFTWLQPWLVIMAALVVAVMVGLKLKEGF